jgi:hypothetical protein
MFLQFSASRREIWAVYGSESSDRVRTPNSSHNGKIRGGNLFYNNQTITLIRLNIKTTSNYTK